MATNKQINHGYNIEQTENTYDNRHTQTNNIPKIMTKAKTQSKAKQTTSLYTIQDQRQYKSKTIKDKRKQHGNNTKKTETNRKTKCACKEQQQKTKTAQHKQSSTT